MKFSNLALVAALAATPAVADAFSFSRFPLFRPTVVTTPSRLLQEFESSLLPARVWHGPTSDWLGKETSPRYEITSDENKFEIAVDVPGMKAEDIHISIEDDGILAIEGQREASGENYKFSSKFSQRFSLDPSVEIEKFTANLNDGVLVISAPKDMKKIEEAVRRIPITEGAAPVAKKDDTGEPIKIEHKKEEHVKVEHEEAKDPQTA